MKIPSVQLLIISSARICFTGYRRDDRTAASQGALRRALEELIRYSWTPRPSIRSLRFPEFLPSYGIFRSYSWPGNVRELFHVLDYAQNVADGETLRREHLPGYLRKFGEESRGVQTSAQGRQASGLCREWSFRVSWMLMNTRFCRRHWSIMDIISRRRRTRWVEAAELQYRIKKYGIII